MVFAINCGPDGAPNSFANFKAAALAVGARLRAGATQTTPPPATTTWTAAYGSYTIPPPPSSAEATKTITLESSTWVTTYTSYAGSPDPTPSTLTGVVHKVIVGAGGQLVFDPQHIKALPRDIVTFEFRQKNHTVTQSSFADPCRKLTVNGAAIGFDSDFMPVADGATTFPTWNFTVKDTAPVWAYCKQKTPVSHCGKGMVFAINSDESGPRNFQAFSDLAKNLNGTVGGVSQPTGGASESTPASGAASLHVSGVLALALTAVVAVLL